MPFPTYANGDELYTPETSSAKSPSNRSRLSFVPCPIEWYAGFDTNATRGSLQGFFGTGSLKGRFFREMAGNLATDPPSPFGDNTDVDYNGGFFARNSAVVNAAGAPVAGSVYSSPGAITGLKYDLFVRTKPKQPGPMGVLPCFFQTGGVQDGSNCVGIISARQRVYRNGGGSLNISVHSLFGVMGFQQTVSSGGNPVAGPGFGLGPTAPVSFENTSLVAPSQRYNPYWGNTSSRIEALGVTALRCQVWDGWPPYLTLWIAQYFTPLHFNPGKLGSKSETKVYSCDMIVPPLDSGTTVTDTTTIETLPDISDWDVDTSRRGMLVTGGLKYTQKTICFDKAGSEIRVAGEGYANGDTLKNTTTGVEIVVNSVSEGGVSSWSFRKDSDDNDLNGEDLNRSTFAQGKTLSFPKSGASTTCLIKFTQGIVENKNKREGPKQHISNQVLTPPSDGSVGTIGVGRYTNISTKTVNLPANPNAPSPGSYDVFYHFHSDPAANPRNGQLSGVSSGEDIKHVTITVS